MRGERGEQEGSGVLCSQRRLDQQGLYRCSDAQAEMRRGLPYQAYQGDVVLIACWRTSAPVCRFPGLISASCVWLPATFLGRGQANANADQTGELVCGRLDLSAELETIWSTQ